MGVKSRGQDKLPVAGRQFCLAIVNRFRGRKPDSAVAMLAVVPGEEVLTKGTRNLRLSRSGREIPADTSGS